MRLGGCLRLDCPALAIEHKHDGVRRWAVYYKTASGSSATFYSDALTMAGAFAHFERSALPGEKSSHIRRVKPDDWMDKR